MKANEVWVSKILEELASAGLDRRLEVYPEAGGKISIHGKDYLNFSSNDYLNLARNPHVLKKAKELLERFGAGASASRLVTGTLACHQELESLLSLFLQQESALVFGAGYLANIGVVSTLVGRNDCIVADRLVHASLIDGITLSRAELFRFRHNDLQHLEELLRKAAASRRPKSKIVVITESVFSMDGDLAPLAQIAVLSEKFGAMLVVDEAHALGVFGPNGNGLVREQNLQQRVNVCTATLSKALGSYGGFAVCSKSLQNLFVHQARPFLYNTALPPAQVGAALGALEILVQTQKPGVPLLQLAKEFRRELFVSGLNVFNSESHIVPLIVGDNLKTLSLSKRLRQNGIIAIAMRSPTVPQGSARLRFSLTAVHTKEDLKRAAEIVIDSAKEERLI